MEILQFRYPFESPQIDVPQKLDRTNLHIGVSMPFQYPWWENRSGTGPTAPAVKFSINGKTFVANPRGILEFADLAITSLKIDLNSIWGDERVLRETIIDIGFEDVET